MRPASLVLVLLGAAAAAEEAPLLSASLPDLTASRERFAASPYGALWNDPGLDRVRAELLGQLAAHVVQASGVDLLELMSGASGAELVLDPPPPGADGPSLLLQVRGTEAAAALGPPLRRLAPVVAPGTEAPAGVLIGDDHVVLGLRRTPRTLPAPAVDHDLHLAWEPAALVARLRAQDAPGRPALVDLVEDLLPRGRLAIDLDPAGLVQRLELDGEPAGLAAVDRSLLVGLPADAYGVVAIGLDGGAWWTAHREAVLAAAAHELPGANGDPAIAESQIEALLQGFGVPGGLGALLGDLQGTALLVIGNGALLPSLALAVPRGPSVDQVVSMGLGFAGMMAPPAGELRFLTVRNPRGRGMIGTGLAYGRDEGHWWITTDPVFLADRFASRGGGWNASTAGAAALAAAGDGAQVVAGFDSRRGLRLLPAVAGFAGSLFAEGRHVEALSQAALRVAVTAEPDVAAAETGDDGRWRLTMRGPIGGMPQTAIVAAILIPNLLESRVGSNEAAAAATLRSGIRPNQLQFQAMGYNDVDGDLRGEYGFLAQMAGTEACFGMPDVDGISAGEITMLPESFGEAADRPIDGYRFVVYLPDGKGGAMDLAEAKRRLAAGDTSWADAAERYYVAYAWPDRFGDGGRRVFAITQEGRVLAAPVDHALADGPPPWNAAFGGRTGPAAEVFRAPDWAPYSR